MEWGKPGRPFVYDVCQQVSGFPSMAKWAKPVSGSSEEALKIWVLYT